VILATGGGGQLFKLNLNPKDVTADGYAIGLRAGAEIINMEFMQAGLGLVHPLSNILNCWVWYLRPRLLNNRGEEFLAKYLPSGVEPLDCMREKAHHFPFSSRDLSKYIETAIIKEINLGNYGPHGGVYIDFRQIDLSKVSRDFQTMWQTTKCWYKKLGVDPDEELLEVAPFGHAINGGLRVGPNGESTVEKLFAVGEVAGGPHGADRLGGNMILCCQVFGKRAGRAAADASASAGKQGRTPAGSLNLTIKGINAGQGRLNPAQVKKEIQELISANYLVVRNARGLETLIEKAQEIVARMETEGFRITAPSDKVQALECRNMLDVATMMAKAALLREESRGSHYREDFPDPKPEFSKIISFQLCGEKLRHKTIQTN
jgi:succinate dehydrogenase/fumarate reductase flavoprotein subunit